MINLEFILNKIDTSIREKLKEETKEDKVHSGKSINVNKDLENQEKNVEYKNLKENTSEGKKYITIDGVKNFNEKVSIKVEKIDEINVENSKGKILDAKK